MHETKIENNKSEINNLTIVDYNMWSYRDFFFNVSAIRAL